MLLYGQPDMCYEQQGSHLQGSAILMHNRCVLLFLWLVLLLYQGREMIKGLHPAVLLPFCRQAADASDGLYFLLSQYCFCWTFLHMITKLD